MTAESTERVAALLQRAQRAFTEGMRARSQGQWRIAGHAFLDAAEALLRAAEISPPGLREHRRALARRLRDEVERLTTVQYRASTTPAGAPLTIAADTTPEEGQESWLITERPQVRFDDVAGLDAVKEQIRARLVYPFLHRDLAKKYRQPLGGGLLLYGPPGTGKTLLARAVAGEIQAPFFAIKPSQIMSQWVGKAEQNLAHLFAQARSYEVSVIFIDEFEALAPRRRTSRSTVMQRVVPQLLAEMDGFQRRDNALLFIGATNEPWAIDEAVLRPGRMDRLIYVPPPDFAARRKILEIHLQGVPLATDVDLEALAARTQGFSGADMAALATRTRERAFLRAVHTGEDRPISQADFEAILEQISPSISEAMLQRYARFAVEHR